jgi:N-acetylneuraminate synthase
MFKQEIKIGNRVIGKNTRPFIIAEMSGNHNQSLERALELVKFAADSGVDAIKLQTFKPDTITMDCRNPEFIVGGGNDYWEGESLFDLYKKAATPYGWHKEIFNKAKEYGLLAFSSPFDTEAVGFLESLDVPCYKIASFENTDHLILEAVAKTGKPVIMSTGVSKISDIQESIEVLKKNGCKELVLLKCTSSYPASPSSTNISTIPHMKELYGVPIGLSDHTMGLGVSIASVALGAVMIEKHFTLDRNDGGVDSAFSLEPIEFEALVKETERAFLSIGKPNYTLSEKEVLNKSYKRSLYVVKDIKKGELISDKNIKSIRPGLGLHTRNYKEVLNRKATTDIKRGTPLAWSHISKN